MPRPRILTDDERKENRKNLDSHVVKLKVPQRFLDDINEFAEQYKSRNKCIIDLIKTHPEYKKFKQNKSKLFITKN